MKKALLVAAIAALAFSSNPVQAVECSDVTARDLRTIYGSDEYYNLDAPDQYTNYTGGTYVGDGQVRQKPGC